MLRLILENAAGPSYCEDARERRAVPVFDRAQLPPLAARRELVQLGIDSIGLVRLTRRVNAVIA